MLAITKTTIPNFPGKSLKRRQNSNKTGRRRGAPDGSFISASGLLAASGLALVLAPQSGEKTLKELEKKSRKWRKEAGKRLEETGESLHESGGEILEDAEELVGDWSAEISEAVERGIRSIRAAVEDEIGQVEKRLRKKKKGLFR